MLEGPIPDDEVFSHPALRPSNVIWIPNTEVEAISEMVQRTIPEDISFSDIGAVLKDGHVEIDSGPPCEGSRRITKEPAKE